MKPLSDGGKHDKPSRAGMDHPDSHPSGSRRYLCTIKHAAAFGGNLTLELELRLSTDISRSLVEDPNASEKAIRIRESLLHGDELTPTR